MVKVAEGVEHRIPHTYNECLIRASMKLFDGIIVIKVSSTLEFHISVSYFHIDKQLSAPSQGIDKYRLHILGLKAYSLTVWHLEFDILLLGFCHILKP